VTTRLPLLLLAGAVLIGLGGVTSADQANAARVATSTPTAAKLPPWRFQQIASGVVLIRTFNCRGAATGGGSGFLVGTKLVMTARHVVDHPKACATKVRASGRWIKVKSWNWWRSGRGTGRAEDLATLRLSSPAGGHIFAFRNVPPAAGTNLAMVGHPLGNQISVNQGKLLFRRRADGVPLLIVNLLGAEGASGSAFVDNDGKVVGILQRGLGSFDILGQNTSGVVVGLDLASWWGSKARKDLCRVYPLGGIPGCGVSPVAPPPQTEPEPEPELEPDAVNVTSVWISSDSSGIARTSTIVGSTGGSVYLQLTFDAPLAEVAFNADWITPSGRVAGTSVGTLSTSWTHAVAQYQFGGLPEQGLWKVEFSFDGVRFGSVGFTVEPG
jgi:hypothetical protein